MTLIEWDFSFFFKCGTLVLYIWHLELLFVSSKFVYGVSLDKKWSPKTHKEWQSEDVCPCWRRCEQNEVCLSLFLLSASLDIDLPAPVNLSWFSQKTNIFFLDLFCIILLLNYFTDFHYKLHYFLLSIPFWVIFYYITTN